MKIVIDISEEIFKKISDRQVEISDVDTICYAILHSKPYDNTKVKFVYKTKDVIDYPIDPNIPEMGQL